MDSRREKRSMVDDPWVQSLGGECHCRVIAVMAKVDLCGLGGVAGR